MSTSIAVVLRVCLSVCQQLYCVKNNNALNVRFVLHERLELHSLEVTVCGLTVQDSQVMTSSSVVL